jgi:hypothetical protein
MKADIEERLKAALFEEFWIELDIVKRPAR